MKRVLYIGEFPPPIGGVTIKNDLLKRYIFMDSMNEFFDLYDCKKNRLNILSLIKKILQFDRFIIGVGSNRRLTCILQLIRILKGEKKLKNCVIFMMGSTLHIYCKNHPLTAKLLRNTKSIYTESLNINEQFNAQGINQTNYFPNCRINMCNMNSKKREKKEPLKLLFFSKICKEKGVDTLFCLLDEIKNTECKIILDFYGLIDSSYQDEFKINLKKHKDICNYCGVFNPCENDIYEKLHEYDLLLFPSTWKGEGVPGILIESKMAGIPCIVSNHNFNKEIIINQQEGIVVSGNQAYGFKEAIIKLYNDDAFYNKLANGAFLSRKRYDISEYVYELRNLWD